MRTECAFIWQATLRDNNTSRLIQCWLTDWNHLLVEYWLHWLHTRNSWLSLFGDEYLWSVTTGWPAYYVVIAMPCHLPDDDWITSDWPRCKFVLSLDVRIDWPYRYRLVTISRSCNIPTAPIDSTSMSSTSNWLARSAWLAWLGASRIYWLAADLNLTSV